MATVEYAHVSIGPDGVPVLSGTQTKVVEIAQDHLAHGSDAEEIHRQHPDLSMGQIYSALAYYYDHQEEMDRDIARRLAKVEEIRARLGDSELARKLRLQKDKP
jgi:uncharacterized protein (DUF433 family)